MTRTLKISALTGFAGLLLFGGIASADKTIDPNGPSVKCKDGTRIYYNPSVPTSAAALCADHGGPDNGPAMANPNLSATFSVPRSAGSPPILAVTPIDRSIWEALRGIGKDVRTTQQIRELMVKNDVPGIKALLNSKVAIRGLDAVYIGPLSATVMTFQIPTQGCNGQTTYYAVGGILVDLATNCS